VCERERTNLRVGVGVCGRHTRHEDEYFLVMRCCFWRFFCKIRVFNKDLTKQAYPEMCEKEHI